MIFGTHYEYPFGGMATRPEWLPRGEQDWRRDLAMIKDTGFDAIRIRIGFDSDIDEVGRLLDLCAELEVGVLFGFATFYVGYPFFEEHPDARVVDRGGNAYPEGPHHFLWPRACVDHPAYGAAVTTWCGPARAASAAIRRSSTGTSTTSPPGRGRPSLLLRALGGRLPGRPGAPLPQHRGGQRALRHRLRRLRGP